MTGNKNPLSSARKPVEHPTYKPAEKDPTNQEAPLTALLQQGQLDHRLLTPAGILQLQRMIGNDAVAHLIANQQESGPAAVSLTGSPIQGKQIQRQEGELIKDSDTLKKGTKVKILKSGYPRFQVQELSTQKTFWISGEIKDYFQPLPSVQSGDSSNGQLAVVKEEPPPAKVVEEITPPSPAANGVSSGQQKQPPSSNPSKAVEKAFIPPKVQTPEKPVVPAPSSSVEKQPPPSPRKTFEKAPSPVNEKPPEKPITPVKSVPSSSKKKVSGPSLNERLKNKDYPTMGRVQDPTWDIIEPVLDGYGKFTKEEKQKMKDKLEKSPVKPRGVPDLIAMTFPAKSAQKMKDSVAKVKQNLTSAAPDLTTWRQKGQTTTRGARGDTRLPHEVRESGGLFGWNEGIVTLSHAKSIVKNVMEMSVQEQSTWISAWKWPTPDPKEKNPWVATGIGKTGGQKGGGEFIYELPLIFHATDEHPMVIATDTGDLETASVIGVRLEEKGEEVVMLTGIPWKYVTIWSGSLEGQPVAEHNPDAAADKTQKLKKT